MVQLGVWSVARYLLPMRALLRLWQHRDLIRQLIVRDVEQRYRGSYLGIVWSFLTPMLMLMAYTFVFSVIFQVRWSATGEQTSIGSFALMLFAGLIPYNMLAETAIRAPQIVVSTPNYVKKVVFPLEVLPVMIVGSAFVHSLVSAGILLIATILVHGSVSAGAVLIPLAYIPLLLLCVGMSWLLAALGVYIRDIGQGMTVVVQLLMFLSPIFYPVAAVPDWLQAYLYLNPLTPIVGMFRGALVWDELWSWPAWLGLVGFTGAIACLGYGWFMVNRRGFADVL